MSSCKAAWGEGEPLAVAEAETWAFLYRQPIPAWLERAVFDLAIGRRSKSQAKRLRNAAIQMARYSTVRDLKVGIPGLYDPITAETPWERIYAMASEGLAGSRAAGSADTMKKAYQNVRRDLKKGRGGKYFTLKDRRLADMPGPNRGSAKRRDRARAK